MPSAARDGPGSPHLPLPTMVLPLPAGARSRQPRRQLGVLNSSDPALKGAALFPSVPHRRIKTAFLQKQ